MYKPLVSIIMPTYNDSLYLRETIDSVLKQTFKNWEFIIINDASTDDTDAIIKEYSKKDRRFVYINKTKNVGLTKNLNNCIDIAKGEFIARLDGDDYWTDKTKLTQQVNYLIKNQGYGMVGCFAYAVDTSDKKLFEIKYPSEDKNIRTIMLKHGPFVHSSILVRKQTLVEIGKYNPEYLYSQDYDLYLNLGTKSKFHNIPKFMLNYRINPLGISRTKYIKQHNEIIKILIKYRKFYPGFLIGFLLWNLRRLYPVWFRGSLSRQIKKNIFVLHKLSGI